jgi:hypothetical protein
MSTFSAASANVCGGQCSIDPTIELNELRFIGSGNLSSMRLSPVVTSYRDLGLIGSPGLPADRQAKHV